MHSRSLCGDIFFAVLSIIILILAIYGMVAFVAPGRIWSPFSARAPVAVPFNHNQVLLIASSCPNG